MKSLGQGYDVPGLAVLYLLIEVLHKVDVLHARPVLRFLEGIEKLVVVYICHAAGLGLFRVHEQDAVPVFLQFYII